MKITKSNAWLLSAIVCTVLAVGCQKGTDRPTTYAVTGTVTQAGAPVAGAIVSFSPGAGGQGATGRTDDSGKYALSTFGGDDGALPGEYGVTISKFEGQEEPGAGAGEDSQDSAAYEAAQQAAMSGEEPEAPKNLLPEKYSKAETSGFSATVTEGGDNKFDFELE